MEPFSALTIDLQSLRKRELRPLTVQRLARGTIGSGNGS